MVSQVTTGNLATWLQDHANKPKTLKDCYFMLDCGTDEANQRCHLNGPFISVAKTGETLPYFRMLVRDVTVDVDAMHIIVAVDVADRLASRKYLFKFAGDGKTVADKVASVKCSSMKRAMVLDTESREVPGFLGVVLKLGIKDWPSGWDAHLKSGSWILPDASLPGSAADFVKNYRIATQVHQPVCICFAYSTVHLK